MLVLTKIDKDVGKEFQLWAFSADLAKQTLLLQGNRKKLNVDSFFDFIETDSQTSKANTEQSSQLQLACFTVDYDYGDYKSTWYAMPERLEDEEEEEKTDNVKPLEL